MESELRVRANNHAGGLSRTAATVAAFLLILLASLAHADLNRWMPYPGVGANPGGPWGGSVRRLVVTDPSVGSEVFAATGGGVYRSGDGGQSWTALNNGLSSLDIADLAICKSKPWVMVATSARNGVYRTDDAGAHWTRLPDPAANTIPLTWLGAVAINPNDSNDIVIGTFDQENDNYVFQSLDGGQTWANGTGTDKYRLRKFARRILFASGGQNIIVGDRNGFLLTCDKRFGGQKVIGSFYDPYTTLRVPILDLALPSDDLTTIVVAADHAGVKVTTNGGTTWKTFLVNDYYKRTIDPAISAAFSVAVDPSAPSRVLMAFYDKIKGVYTDLFQSADFLATTPVKIALPESGLRVTTMAVTGLADLLGEASAGVYRRPFDGSSYAHSSLGLNAFQITDFDFTPTGTDSTHGGHALAVSGGVSRQPVGNAGIITWSPQAQAWTRHSGTGARTGPTRLVRYETDDILWMSVEGFTIYRSADGGNTWSGTSLGETYTLTNSVYSMAFGPLVGQSYLAGSGATFYTTDGWSTSAPVATLPTSNYVLDYNVGENKGYYAASLVSGTFAGVYYAPGFDRPWSRSDGIYFNDKTLASFAASKKVPGHLLAGTHYVGLYESFNYGMNWTLVNAAGLPQSGYFGPIALGYADGDQVAAAYADDANAIYVTGDGGANWSRITAGLETADLTIPGVYALQFAPDGKSLIAGIDGMGLRFIELGGPPSIANQGSYSVFAERPFQLKLLGSDPDGQQVTYRIDNPPQGAALSGDTLSWTPTGAQAGENWLTFTISDGFYTKSYTYLVTVLPANHPPVFDPVPDATAIVGVELAVTLNAADQDGQAVSYSADNLPAGATLTGARFSWTPLSFQAGDHPVTFIAYDGVEYTSLTVSITVDTPPLLNPIGDGTGAMQAVVNSTLTITLEGVDPDPGDTLTYFADGVALAANLYTFTPVNTDDKAVTFSARDSRGVYSNAIAITIHVDPDPNSILAPVFTHIADQVVNVGEALLLTISATQPNGLPITITALELPQGATFEQSTGRFSWTAPSDLGTLTARFGASVDAYPEKASTLAVNIATNAAPTVDPVGVVIGLVGAPEPTKVKITGHDPVDSLTYTAEGLPPWSSIDGQTGWITWDVHQLAQRTYVAVVYALDARGNRGSTQVTFKTNNAPVIAPVADKTVTVGKLLSFTVSTQDADSDPTALAIQGLPQGAAFDAGSGAFTWTPSTTQGSPHAVTVIATDDYGASHAVNFSVKVNPVPTPPSSGGGGGGGGGCFLSILGER